VEQSSPPVTLPDEESKRMPLIRPGCSRDGSEIIVVILFNAKINRSNGKLLHKIGLG
jgi:hypothetical protein